MPMLAALVDGVIGVDTHRDSLTAAVVTNLGGVLAQLTTRADAAGYQRLLDFARVQVPGRRCWAVEGAGSFGAGLAAFLAQHGERVVEVGRPKRPVTRTGAKSDALDAARAARGRHWPKSVRRCPGGAEIGRRLGCWWPPARGHWRRGPAPSTSSRR